MIILYILYIAYLITNVEYPEVLADGEKLLEINRYHEHDVFDFAKEIHGYYKADV